VNPRYAIPILCLLFMAQALPWFTYRWVEDDSWYSSTGYTLFHEGQMRNGIFPQTELEGRADTKPIALPATLAVTFAALGVGPAQARIPEFLACMALVPIVYWIGKLLGGSPAVGLLAALLVSVDNMLFLAARIVRAEAFVSMFGLLAVLLYLLSRRRDSVMLAILSGLSLGLSFNYHVNGFGIAAGIGLLLLAEFRLSIWRSKRAWALVLASAATLIPFFVWVAGDPVRWQSFLQQYSRGSYLTLHDVIQIEASRYRDLLGIGNQRFHFLPFPLPLRLHIVLLTIVSMSVLAVKKRSLFWTLLALMVPCMALWTRLANPPARYFAVIAPYCALAAALAFYMIARPKWRTIFGCWCGLVVISEIAGNALLLRQARTADYVACTERLRSLIPQDARVYGVITFFMGLHDYTYCSLERTPPETAAQGLQATYMILNDRLLVHGSGFGKDDFKELRESANQFVRTNADLVGRVPDPFYGDLEVYRVRRSQVSGSAEGVILPGREETSTRVH